MEFKVVRNDIAKMDTDVVVLPANRRLAIGTGASMALFEAAGRRELESACSMQLKEAKRRKIKLVPGIAIPTSAYNLPSKIILHTIAPKWRPNKPEESYNELCKAYSGALSVADSMGCESIAFPFLSSGNNGFDADLAMDIAVESLKHFEPKGSLKQAYLVAFGGSITQKMRDRGYEVEEFIGQEDVFNQSDHQHRNHGAKAHGGAGSANVSDMGGFEVAQMIDAGMQWLQDPEHTKMIFTFAVGIARLVLPRSGKFAAVHKVLDFVDTTMFSGGKDKR
ncbi:MAG: macro domain-containing protein [Coriobacteriales bacterium]|nr:macro domain-containing protein [Coriobacteriales bacterium]